ncbi:MAG: hypothetical protein GY909_06220 [Oligoflexia bacterium]|nr:hypothetical protein [Oligoflexia bacterium]
MFSNVIQFYLLTLSLGLGFFCYLANTKETGAGFIRVVMSLCAVSTGIALAFHLVNVGSITLETILYAVSFISFVLVYLKHEDKKSKAMWFLYGLSNLCLLGGFYLFMNKDLVNTLFAYATTGFVGSVTYAMVMGHWYLVTPKLSEKPLKIATLFIWATILIKLAWTGYEYYQNMDMFEQGTTKGAGYMFNWVMLTMRVGWVYLGVGIMSIFGWRLVKMRSIQSATGIFYAMTFFVFGGELFSIYFFFKYGLYL